MKRYKAALSLIAALHFGGVAPAFAEDDADTEVAKRLFREGRDLYLAGNYAKALEAFDRAKLAKPLPAFDYNIARCHDRLGHWVEALAAYERFASSASDASDIRDAKERIPVLRARVKTAADHAIAEEQYKLAISAYNNGQYIPAADAFKLSYKAVPEPAMLYNVAQAYRLAGNSASAIEYYRRYLIVAPGSPLRSTVEVRIAELKGKGGVAATKGEAGAAKTGEPKVVIVGNAQSTPTTPSKAPATAATSPSSAPPTANSDRLKPVAELIKTNRGGFRACYDAWSKQHPGVPGQVTLSFYLDPDGLLNQATAATRGFESPEVSACIVDYARTLTYPPSAVGKYTRINYPFDFKPN